MKSIQFLFITAIMSVISLSAIAQAKTGTTFGVRAGFDMANINGKNQNGDPLKFDLVPRFNIGVVAEIPIATGFYVQPALLYTTKGANAEKDFLGLDMGTEYNLSYIQMPINLLYKPALGTGKMLIGFGPYVAYGVGGKAKYAVEGAKSEEKIKFTKEYTSLNPMDQNHFKPLDYGGNILLGYQLGSGISAQLNAQLGMAQIKSDNTLTPNSEVAFKNTSFGISIGYQF